MSRKKMMAFSITVSVLLMLAIVFSLFFMGKVKTPSAVLPTATSPGTGPTPSGAYWNDVERLEITTGNVQAVIEKLSRPVSYSSLVVLDSYIGQVKISYQVTVWVKNKVFKTSAWRVGGSQVLNTIVTEDYVYIWYDDGPDYRRLKLGQDSPEQVADEYQKIPSYEDILLLDKDDILEAGYAEYENEPCVYVKANTGLLGYTYEYYVSARTGLLVRAETYDGDKLIHSTTVDSPNISEPPDDTFRLPDGSSAIIS